MVTIHTELLPLASTGRRPRTNTGRNPVTTVTIHDTQNTDRGAGAETHSRVQKNGSMPRNSWHATVDEKGVWVNYADTDRCWHAGQGTGNNTSYSIEIAVNSDGDYPKAVANAAEYAALVLKRNGLGVDALRQHNAWTGKDCPKFIRAGRSGITWARFKSLVQAALDGTAPSTPAPSTPAPVAPKPTTNPAAKPSTGAPYAELLVDGVRGPVTIRAWQHLMTAIGRYKGRIDGDFGPLTAKAMQSWLAGLGHYKGRIDGDWGPLSVKALQAFLAKKGLYKGYIDGKEGPLTVKASQKYLNGQRKTWG